MTTPQASSTKRLKNVTVAKGIVTGMKSEQHKYPHSVGSQAFWLGKVDRKPEEHSHRWHVYLRGPNNEDLSYFIKKVVFILHETFEQPHRGKCYVRLLSDSSY